MPGRPRPSVRLAFASGKFGASALGELVLYGLDEAGEAAFTEKVTGERAELRRLAEARLADWPAVEVWDGPLCVIRIRRRTTPPT